MGRCLVCGTDLKYKVLTLDNMPRMAQKMPSKSETDTESGITLDLFQCRKCGMVQFDCEPVPYYRDVIRACGVSEKMRSLKKEQYSDLIGLFGLEGKKIWEVGCGGGEFLEILSDFPVQAFGVEHDPALVGAAREKGLTVEEGFVGGSEYRARDGPFDAFLSFNFLEHQPDPNGMLQGIHGNLTDEGVGIITVPSFEYFLENASYYELIRDHIGCYTKESLSYLLIQNGFDIVREGIFNGDSLYVYVRKRKDLKPEALMGNKEMIEAALMESIGGLGPEDGIAVWGASHQAFTLLSTTALGGSISCIIDSAPFKTGYYSPASHIEIVSPDILRGSDIECVVIIAPSYSDEIHRQILRIKPGIKRIVSVVGDTVHILKE